MKQTQPKELKMKDEQQKVEIISPSRSKSPRVGTIRMAMRLLIGGAVIGREELKKRFQEKQSETHFTAVELNEVTPIETDTDRLRYATLGAVTKSTNALQKGVSILGRISNKTYARLTHTLSPITNSNPMKPVRRQYQRFIDRGDMILSDWIATGRREEYLSRQLAQKAATETIEETLDYLAISPEMDELMLEQSGDLIEGVFGDAKGGISKNRLILLDWINASIFRRPRHKSDSKSDVGPPEGG
jgi:hypothetical protein